MAGVERVKTLLRERDADCKRALPGRRVARLRQACKYSSGVRHALSFQILAGQLGQHVGVVWLDAQPGFEVSDRQPVDVAAAEQARFEFLARKAEHQHDRNKSTAHENYPTRS